MKHYGNILVVDDNPIILTALKICLKGTFENIYTLSTPDSIMDVLEKEIVNAMLLDMNFAPGVNDGHEGIAWLQRLREAFPNLPIVLMTAYGDVPLAVKGLKAGAADFVTKPWDNDTLLRTLKDAIDKSQEIVPLEEVEAAHIRRVVESCAGNITRAAELLGVTRQTIYKRMNK